MQPDVPEVSSPHKCREKGANMLIKDKEGFWRMTRLAAHLRYVRTIKPIEDLLNYLDGEEDQTCQKDHKNYSA